MKKILLLLAIFISVFSVKAQSSGSKTNSTAIKSSQFASVIASPDGFIENITVYPNPVADELRISFRSSHRSMAQVSLFNNIGKQVLKQEADVEPGNNMISIDIRSKSIESGVYFIQILSENQTITRKLIVK